MSSLVPRPLPDFISPGDEATYEACMKSFVPRPLPDFISPGDEATYEAYMKNFVPRPLPDFASPRDEAAYESCLNRSFALQMQNMQHNKVRFLPETATNTMRALHRVFFSAFCPRRGKMRLYGLLGGQVRICVQSMGQTRGIWGNAPPRKFCFMTF